MIPALVAALSVPGVVLAWRLLRPLPPRAWDVPAVEAELPEVRFGFDSRGLVG